MELAKANKWKRLLPLLAKQRINLLDSVHDGQKQIDCLDFLSLQDIVDSEKIGIIGICGWGGMAINTAGSIPVSKQRLPLQCMI